MASGSVDGGGRGIFQEMDKSFRDRIGRQGMHLAARVLGTTAWDLYQQPETIAVARQEFTQRLGNRKYEPLPKPNQSPPLNYGNPPSRRRAEH